jgi:hypothetical protein
MTHDFAAPPARQASEPDCLAVWGKSATVGLGGPTNNNDLPLTAFFRRHSDRVTASAIVSAAVGLLAVGLPFIVARF